MLGTLIFSAQVKAESEIGGERRKVFCKPHIPFPNVLQTSIFLGFPSLSEFGLSTRIEVDLE